MVNETKNSIRRGMLSLMKEKEYREIQMKEIAQRSNIGRRTLYRYFENKEDILRYIAESLVDRFGEEIEKEETMTLYTVVHAFFVFLDHNRDEFRIMKKARQLDYMQERLPMLIARVAAKTKYKGQSIQSVPFLGKAVPTEDKYYFYFIFAGFWRVAMTWLDDRKALSPERMTELTLQIMNRENG